MTARRLALFDFDGTMMEGDSIGRLVRYFREKNLLSLFGHIQIGLMALLWKMGLATVKSVKTLALAPLNKLNGPEAQSILQVFVKEQLLPYLYKDAVDQMNRHAEGGDAVLLVSASPLCYLQYISEALPVSGIIGTLTNERYQVTRNVVKDEKVDQIRQWLIEHHIEADWENSAAYGDSSSDLPMLQLTGKRFLINPKANALRLGSRIPVKHWV
jgi:phosphatidylglycerophosphatase C